MSIKPLECAVFEIAQAYDGLYTHQARYNASDTGTSVLCVYVYVALRCQVSLAMPHARHWPAGVTADTVPPPPPRRCGPPRIDYASECGPTSADTVRHSGYDSTIENTTLSREMTIDRSPCTTEFGSSHARKLIMTLEAVILGCCSI